MLDTVSGRASHGQPLLSAFRSLIRLSPFHGRFASLGRLLLIFLAVNALIRVGLGLFNQDLALFAPWRIVPALAIGLVFDLTVGLIGLAPLTWLYAIWPAGRPANRRALRLVAGAILAPLTVLVSFVGLSEFTFWNEFASRFNFIAVDYLIYTNEVVGNIRESYNLPVLLAVWFMSHLEKQLRKRIPDALDLILTPFLTVVITGFVALLFIGPAGRMLGDGISFVLSNLINHAGWLDSVANVAKHGRGSNTDGGSIDHGVTQLDRIGRQVEVGCGGARGHDQDQPPRARAKEVVAQVVCRHRVDANWQ